MYAEKTDYDNIEMSSRLQNILKKWIFLYELFYRRIFAKKKIYMPYYVNLTKIFVHFNAKKNNKNTLIFTRISAILYLVPLRRVDYV
mgnify:CR=1 FL=1